MEELRESYKEEAPDYNLESKDIIVVGGKNYQVFDRTNLNPYELDFIYRDQVGDEEYESNPKYSSIREAAMPFQFKHYANPGPFEVIPYRKDDPRYQREYERQMSFLQEEESKRADPIGYYTKGVASKSNLMAAASMFSPLLIRGGAAAMYSPFSAPAGLLATTLGLTIASPALISNTYDRVNEVIRNFSGQDPEYQKMSDQMKQAMDDVYYESMFALGGPTLGGIFRSFKPGVGKVLGLSREEAQALIQSSKDLGIDLAPIHFSRTNVKGSASYFGVIPFLAGFYRKGGETAQTALAKFANSLTGQYAPVEMLQSLGVDMMKASQQRFKGYRKLTDILYNRALNFANQIQTPFIPMTNVKSFAEANVEKILRSDLPENIREQYEGLMGLQRTSEFKTFFESLSKLDMLDANQYRSMEKMLNNSITEYVNSMGKSIPQDQAVAIMQLKNALKKDFNNVDISMLKGAEQEIASKFISSLRTANDTVAAYASLLDGPQANIFKKFNKGAFLVDFMKPGSKNVDVMFRDIFKELDGESLEAVDALKTLLGKNTFNKAAGSWFNDTYLSSFRGDFAPKRDAMGLIDVDQVLKSNIFDPDKFEAALGIAGDSKFGKAKLDAIMGPEAYKNIRKFIDLAKAVDEVDVGDVSKYLTRKVTLGGLDRFIGTGALLYGASASLPLTVVKVLLGRKGASFLNDPKRLDELIKLTDQRWVSGLTADELAKYVVRLARGVDIPTDEEYEEMQLLYEIQQDIEAGKLPESKIEPGKMQLLRSGKEAGQTPTGSGAIPSGTKIIDTEEVTSIPTNVQNTASAITPGLPGSVDPAKFGMLFPNDITGQQAAMSMFQKPRIANQGGLARLLGFKV